MKEIHTEVMINAEPERVWESLTDLASFPEWNPFIRSAEGELLVGGKLKIVVQPSGGKAMSFKPKVLKYEPNRELRWKGRLLMPGIFDGEHHFIIEPTSEGQCRFVHGEKFSGLLVPLFAKSLDRDARRGFQEMNQALKERAEGVSSA